MYMYYDAKSPKLSNFCLGIFDNKIDNIIHHTERK